jgi:subtilisin family serine protease
MKKPGSIFYLIIMLAVLSLCQTAYSDPTQIDTCGVLMAAGECLYFIPFNGSDLYVLDNYDEFGPSDSVHITGTRITDCRTECSIYDYCVTGNTIEAYVPLEFTDIGILTHNSSCVLFALDGDSNNLYLLENYGAFKDGDTVYVQGNVDEICGERSCNGVIACVYNNNIDDVDRDIVPIPGNVIFHLEQNSNIDDVLYEIAAEVIDSIPHEKIFLVHFSATITHDDFLDLIGDHPNIIHAEPNYEVDLPENLQMSISFPDQNAAPHIPDEGSPSGFYNQQSFYSIGADSAHLLTTGEDAVIAIIDNGFDIQHTLLVDALTQNGYDFIDDDTDPSPAYGSGTSHGTFVSGLIRLTAPGSRIMPIRALNMNGTGDSYTIAKSIFYAVRNGADIINMSFGTYEPSYLLNIACQSAIDALVIMVAASGNDSSFLPVYPAAFDGVISVSAIDSLDELANFSNFGSNVDVCAPGVDLYSALNDDCDWGTWTGTSFATPLVSAVCAMSLTMNEQLTPYEMIDHLRYSAETELSSGSIIAPDYYYGYGRIDAADAVWSLYSPPPEWIVGDANRDDNINVSDAVFIINYVFVSGSPTPDPMEVADANCDQSVNVSDAVYIINFVFITGSPAPCSP